MSRPPRRLAALLAAAVALAGTGVGEEPHFAPAVARLAGYLRVDTSNPPGNERAGARYGVPAHEILQRVGEAGYVGGQEDMIIDIALQIAEERDLGDLAGQGVR